VPGVKPHVGLRLFFMSSLILLEAMLSSFKWFENRGPGHQSVHLILETALTAKPTCYPADVYIGDARSITV
jgi:hypothetical protein